MSVPKLVFEDAEDPDEIGYIN